MSVILRLMIISMVMLVAAPAWASSSAVAVYTCQQDDEASEADINEASDMWLKAANGMKGGENIQVRVMYPVAATMGESDFLFVVIAPNLAEWGAFMDGYAGSAAADSDKGFADLADCHDSALWESFEAGSK